MKILNYAINMRSRGEWKAYPGTEIIDECGRIVWLRWEGRRPAGGPDSVGEISLVRIGDGRATAVEASEGLAWGEIIVQPEGRLLVLGDQSVWTDDELEWALAFWGEAA